MTRRLSGTVIEIFGLEDIEVTTLTFGVTRRHRSRDHSTPDVRFLIRSYSNNHTSILHSYGDNEPQRYCGSDLENAGHVTLPVT